MTQDTYTKLIDLLDQHGAHYRLIDHASEGRTEMVSAMRGNDLSQAANCIVVMLKIGKKTTKFVLAVYPASFRLDLNALKTLFGATYISFASKDIAEKLAGSILGTVLPFSFHSDLELIVDPMLLRNDEMYFNAARLDRSIALRTSDYVAISKPRLEMIVTQSSSPPSSLPSPQSKQEDLAVDDLYRIRHSLAHVLAQSVLRLWPKTLIAIGPPIENGCYYDFKFETPISDADFPRIEQEMKNIIHQKQIFRCDTLSCDEGKKYWLERGQKFKVELIEDLEKHDGVTKVTHYVNVGPDGTDAFTDLCRGGHVQTTGDIPVDGFKIMSLAGAYWRGDETRDQLTRLYLVAFPTKAELERHLFMIEEAKRRDHRKLGKELDLFTFSDLVGPGLALWTPRGTLLRNLLDECLWEMRKAKGYQRVCIPHVTKKELYETSGHWQKFSNELFRITTREGHEFAMKPMNCPHHTQIYACRKRSYRDLPQRYAETTTCYRDEQTGELHGLSRVRAFTQDDGHVFCRESQVKEEILALWEIVDAFYDLVGFGKLKVRLSLHDPATPEKYLGTPAMWQRAEAELQELAVHRHADFFTSKGEAAFYGPKVDFMTKDSIGREWQVATIQLDINMPERFDLSCVNEKGEEERIVMIHAAIMGSIERFLSIYIEHVAGHFPLWLAPIQVAVLPVAPVHEEGAAAIASKLSGTGMRVEYAPSVDSLGRRIRDGEQLRIPYILVLGDRELKDRSVTVRNVRSKAQVTLPLAEFMEITRTEIAQRIAALSIG